MGEHFESVIWRANILALAEEALKYKFHALYDEMSADPANWDLERITKDLIDLRNQVPELAETAEAILNTP